MEENNKKNFNAVVILGPTASGKTSLAVQVAKALGGEIISADSRQVYRELNLGSGKDLDEYDGIPYHLIDICTLAEEYNVFNFQNDCLKAFDEIQRRGALPLIAGGTALYLNAILRDYQLVPVPENGALRERLQTYSQEELAALLLRLNPQLHNKTDLEIRERTIRAIEIAEYKGRQTETPLDKANKIQALIFKINFPRALLRERIKRRLRARIDAGMIDEVTRILDKYGEQRVLRLGLEYKFTALYLQGAFLADEYFEKLYTAICQFAKRQETWFRKMQREGVSMIELDGENIETMVHTILDKVR